MAFIVIEGLDGAGKSTQLNMLRNLLNSKNIPFEYLHFPSCSSPILCFGADKANGATVFLSIAPFTL